jgi:cytochrome c553
MQDHFASVMKIANAVVDGDLEAAQEAAAWFLEHVTEEGLAAGWVPHVARMRESAQRVTTAGDLGAAADATGAMLVRCGECHRAVGASPRFVESIEPALRETAQAEMERHQWALGRLSEGLIGPSEQAWSAGAETLRAPPTCATRAATEVADVAVVHKLARDFDRLAARTRKTADFEARGRLYGDLLATCAACHQSGC